ncbi:MAG: c-type cytochrome [Actinomycetota bacterium]
MRQWTSILAGTAITTFLALGATACGSADSNVAGGDGDPAARGKEIAIANGCAACHGTDGQGGVGPGFVGLAGSTVELEDGTTMVADTEYLRRSIVDPAAEIRPGWSVNMPQRTFEPGEVDAIIEFIQSLG